MIDDLPYDPDKVSISLGGIVMDGYSSECEPPISNMNCRENMGYVVTDLTLLPEDHHDYSESRVKVSSGCLSFTVDKQSFITMEKSWLK